MNPSPTDRAPSVPADAGAAAAGARVARRSMVDRICDVRRVCRQMFGIPDYERYLAHAAERHPSEPVLSRREFCARAIERKYGKSGPRCC